MNKSSRRRNLTLRKLPRKAGHYDRKGQFVVGAEDNIFMALAFPVWKARAMLAEVDRSIANERSRCANQGPADSFV